MAATFPSGPGPTGPDGHGVYVHVPFCATRCDYCAFATWTDKEHLVEAYVATVTAEIEAARRSEGATTAATVFVGGGTPSLLGGRLLSTILGAIDRLPGAEVTVECNPESTTRDLLDTLRDAGVTRISLGVQSMRGHVLAGLGRSHSPGAARRAVDLVGAAGFSSFNVDLIYGGAGETDADWADTLDAILGLEPRPPHVSAYALTVEAGTPLAHDRARHPDDDVQARRYAMAEERLSSAGLDWYELSNWAIPGAECRHNMACWAQGEYRGFGCAAHSHKGGRRSWNIRPLERYMAAVAGTGSAQAGEERLGPAEQSLEALELSLRTRTGVPRDAFSPEDLNVLSDDSGLGPLVEEREGRWTLTLRGRLLANEVAVRLRSPSVANADR